MTDASTSIAKKCEFCDKRGLPLLLVRNAVAAVGSGAPLAGALDIELDARAAHYTTRLLRSGYVNVYDEARKRWESYFVTPEQFFFKLSETPGVVPVLPAKPFNCPDQGHAAIASCVMVSDPKNATTVWIGFSDVLWTAAVRKCNEDAAYRKRHMVAVNVAAAMAGSNVENARPIAQVSAVVAEYAMDRIKGARAFVWNQGRFAPRQTSTNHLLRECEAMRPGKALIVTVPDPVGIAQELALLMKRNVDKFTQEPTRRRHFAADAAISAIESGVRDRAQLLEDAAITDATTQYEQDNAVYLMMSETGRKDLEKRRESATVAVRRAADQDWARYSKKFDVSARKHWQDNYIKELTAYDAKWVGPLAQSHVAWMKSREITNYFTCNYDTENAHSGVAYTEVFTQCTLGTQDKKACTDLYEQWLAGDVTDTKNLLLRAMVYNQEKISTGISKAVTASVSLKSIPWDNLFAIFGLSMERLAQSGHDVAVNLIVFLAGPIARMLGKVLDAKYSVRGAVMALGLISGQRIYKIEFTGKRSDLRKLLAKNIVERSGAPLSPKKLAAAISNELALQRIKGIKLEGETTVRWLVCVDQNLVIIPNASPAAQYEALAKQIRSIEAVENLNKTKFQTYVNKDARFAIVAGLAQCLSLTKLIDDEAKALDHTKLDARMRLVGGIASISASTSEMIGGVWKGAARFKFGEGHLSIGAGRLTSMAKILGVAGGLIVATMDMIQGSVALDEGQNGLAWLYFTSGALGAALTLVLAGVALPFISAIPVIGGMLLLLILINVLIEYQKDNPVQDWLERCAWGIMSSARYTDETIEQAQLQQALKE